VLLIDDTTQFQGKYPYAVVIETKIYDDGLVRSATVKTSDGLIRERNIRKLVMLEVNLLNLPMNMLQYWMR